MEGIVLSEEDRKELTELYEKAQTTPVIGFSMKQMVEGRDLASQAWNRVREKMDALGEKYGFDPKAIRGIDQESGKILV